jgi:glycosyltransferase involved in cell wall biosynthesis
MNCGIVITTHNRPHALVRSLPLILELGAKVIVVDDGSNEQCAENNLSITKKYHVPLLTVCENRGLCCALNMGIAYWLAEPSVDWISSFNDDVDVHPDLLVIMEKVQDADTRPLCTGHDAYEHAAKIQTTISDQCVRMKISCRGVHLHAHRDYWKGVMPIPTPYLGAPKRNKGLPGQGADEDWWITCWSPNSVVKRGLYVTCVPGLVRVFLNSMDDSTWGCTLRQEPMLNAVDRRE